MHNKILFSLGLVSIAAGVLVSPRVVSQGGGGPVLGAPTGIAAFQLAYGADSLVALEWTNTEHYDRVAVDIDGAEVASVFGSETRYEIRALAAGTYSLAVRGKVGDQVSAPASVEFRVLPATPVVEPVADVLCEFAAERGGVITLSWRLGASAWTRGVATIELAVEDGAGGAGGTDGSLDFEIAGGSTALVIAGAGLELPRVTLRFQNAAGYFSQPLVPACSVRVPYFVRGDCDGDGRVTITDAIYELDHLFRGGVRWYCDDACDVNDDGDTDLSDPIGILNHLFRGAPPTGPPLGGPCGADASADFLGGVCGCP
jgi:hypothetical protein